MSDQDGKNKLQWLREFATPSNALQVALVIATCSGIYYQDKIFNLEREYKELSVRPILISTDPRYVAEASIRNVGLGSAQVVEVAYESDSFQRREFSMLNLADESTETRIKSDIRERSLLGLAYFKNGNVTLQTEVDFIAPGTFLEKEKSWFFSRSLTDDFYNKLVAAKKNEEADQSMQAIRRKMIDNQSTYNIEICYCSITKNFCRSIVVGRRGQNKLKCEKWQTDRGF